MAKSPGTKRNRTALKKMAASRSVTPSLPSEVSFDFIKSNLFRVIAVDGAFGGLSPNARKIHMAVYSERRPIPKRTVHVISEEGVLGDEVSDKREVRDAFVREVEADLVISLEVAQAMRAWLDDRITEITIAIAREGDKGEAGK